MTPTQGSAISHSDAVVVGLCLLALAAARFLSHEAFTAAWVFAFAIAAFCAVEVARNLRWFVADDYPLFLALSLAFIAALQVAHGAAGAGLTQAIRIAPSAAEPIELASGFLLAGSMLCAPFTLGHRLRPERWIAAYALATGLLLVAILRWNILSPVHGGAGAFAFERSSDLFVAGALVLAAVLTYRRRRLLDDAFQVAILLALAAAALGWVLKAFLPSDDITHFTAVLFIALTYIAVTKNGLARSTQLLFSQLREQEEEATLMRAQALTDLRLSEERYRTVFEQSPAGLFLFNTDLIITGCNTRLSELVRGPEEVVIGAHVRDLGEPSLAAVAASVFDGQPGTFEGQLKHGAGNDERWVSARAAPLLDADGRVSGGIGIIVDLTEGKRAEELIERLAFHDVLTGLPNRTLFRDRLQQAISSAGRSGRPAALLHVDVDRFADLNHLVGHGAADEVLRMVAARVQPLIRDTDTLARWGADEFVLLLPDVQGSEGALRVAEQVRAALARPWQLARDARSL
ncbi:MAG: diguanylate cyclase [Thermoleophilia bacterium]